jgi:hypothetical protein
MSVERNTTTCWSTTESSCHPSGPVQQHFARLTTGARSCCGSCSRYARRSVTSKALAVTRRYRTATSISIEAMRTVLVLERNDVSQVSR